MDYTYTILLMFLGMTYKILLKFVWLAYVLPYWCSGDEAYDLTDDFGVDVSGLADVSLDDVAFKMLLMCLGMM